MVLHCRGNHVEQVGRTDLFRRVAIDKVDTKTPSSPVDADARSGYKSFTVQTPIKSPTMASTGQLKSFSLL